MDFTAADLEQNRAIAELEKKVEKLRVDVDELRNGGTLVKQLQTKLDTVINLVGNHSMAIARNVALMEKLEPLLPLKELADLPIIRAIKDFFSNRK